MSLIHIYDAYLSFSDLEILKNSVFHINENERVCLIGKNGAGKSTFLKIIGKKQDLDAGNIVYKKNIKIGYLKQENPKNLNISVYNFISKGIQNKKKNNNLNYSSIYNNQEINVNNTVKIETIIDKIELNKNTLLSKLSGGLLRKAALGYVLVGDPDILLLDEPTNHLDIKTVEWLERFLRNFSGSVLFISHDRSFIQNVCTRIVDLDRGKLTSWKGNYKDFIRLKNEKNRIEKIHKKLFDENLEKEEKWIRKGTKARTTRNEGRVKNLKLLRIEQKSYKKIEKLSSIKINEIENHTRKIIFKIEKINYSIKNNVIIKNFSSIVQYGEKIGLIGKNGCGKSTIIKILLEKIKPDSGQIQKGENLNIAYFDQNRSILDPNKSILENISYGKDKIVINGKEEYLIGYLKKFLFNPNQIQSLVKTLSGGECNRLLLARLFLKPSNVLILDEPTNDLDLDSLQLLEKMIIKYKGTALIVSHDREFINNIVNKCWIVKKDGFIDIIHGNYDFILKNKQYANYKKDKKKLNIKFLQKKEQKKYKNINTFNEIRKSLNKIEIIELHIKKLQIKINQNNFFKKTLTERLSILQLLKNEEKKLEKALKYWEYLETQTVKK